MWSLNSLERRNRRAVELTKTQSLGGPSAIFIFSTSRRNDANFVVAQRQTGSRRNEESEARSSGGTRAPELGTRNSELGILTGLQQLEKVVLELKGVAGLRKTPLFSPRRGPSAIFIFSTSASEKWKSHHLLTIVLRGTNSTVPQLPLRSRSKSRSRGDATVQASRVVAQSHR
jgi:hypothetical protein